MQPPLPVSLLSLATAVPPHRLMQAEVGRRAQTLFGPTLKRFPQLAQVFASSGVETRYAARPIDWYERPHDWDARNAAYLDAATTLYGDVAERALAAAGVRGRDVETAVTVSSTGIATPSLESRAAPRLGFGPEVARAPVFGLGCAGGVTGLSLAARLARAKPGSLVLMVAIELCTLAFRFDRGDKADIVATALFGDGAAAALLCAGEPAHGHARVGEGFEHLWPDTRDIMGWSVDPVGLGVILSPGLPRFVEQNLAAPARTALAALGRAASPPRLVCHPGGAKVLRAVETAFDLPPETLRQERAVLREFGNMSAPTVLFVLERVLAEAGASPIVLAALGPGFTASFLALEPSHA